MPPPPQEEEQEQEQDTSTRTFHLGPVRLEVACVETFRGKLLGEGVDATGVMLWPGSFVMCAALLQALPHLPTAASPPPPPGPLDPSLLVDHIVELGAGATGLAGLLAASLGRNGGGGRVTLTDRDPPSLALLEANAARVNHNVGAGRVAVRRLEWGQEAEAAQLVSERGPASLCVGADVLYPAIEIATIRKLLRSARALLRGRQPAGRVLLSFIDRDQGASLRHLLQALRDEAFFLDAAWELDPTRAAALRLEEEELIDGDGGGGEGQATRRRPVVLMRGAKLLLLAPLAPPPPDETSRTMMLERQVEAEGRWLPGVWEVRAKGSRGTGVEEEEEDDDEWAPPLMDDDDDDDD